MSPSPTLFPGAGRWRKPCAGSLGGTKALACEEGLTAVTPTLPTQLPTRGCSLTHQKEQKAPCCPWRIILNISVTYLGAGDRAAAPSLGIFNVKERWLMKMSLLPPLNDNSSRCCLQDTSQASGGGLGPSPKW